MNGIGPRRWLAYDVVTDVRTAKDAPHTLADGAISWQPQPFESEYLKVSSARITAIRGADPAETLRQALGELSRLGHDFVSVRVSADATVQISALRELGAKEIERLVTYARSLDGVDPRMPDGIDFATNEDADGCAEVGRRAFRSDRFHQDSKLNASNADELKAAWMRNACLGRADRVLVAREGLRVVGANACLRNGSDAVIDLIGVLPEVQGRGLGRQLVEAALVCYAGSAKRMVVGTQAANTASTALYNSVGFALIEEKITFHIHMR